MSDQRALRRLNYKEMSEVRLPRAKRVQKGGDDKLYPIEIIDSERDRVKVHYVGYDSSYDEWRESGDVVPLDSPDIDQLSIFTLC